MTFELPRGQPSRRRLLLGLTIITGLVVAQAFVEDCYDRRADARANQLVNHAIASIEQLTRIIHDVDQQRLALVAYYFGENDTAGVELGEAMSALDADIAGAAQAYVPQHDFPGEAELWTEVKGSLDRYQRLTTRIVTLVHARQGARVRREIASLLPVYAELSRKLVRLHELHRAGASRALDRLAALQRSTRRLEWIIRIAVLLALLMVGLWGTHQIMRYEDDLAARSRDLEERNRDLDAFAGRVAHDLKNALGPIVISPEMLRLFAEQPRRVRDIADRTERCSRKATEIIDALLAFSRAAQRPQADESGALVPAVNNVLDEIAPLAASLGATIEVGEIADVDLRCDPVLLHVVLANVCSNAVKYLAGEPERRVHVSARVEGAACRIDVRDTGPGIPEELRSQIFAPFFRIVGARAPGTGIGLATVHRILEARGGRIEVAAAEGRGSRFTVWLPIASAVAAG